MAPASATGALYHRSATSCGCVFACSKSQRCHTLFDCPTARTFEFCSSGLTADASLRAAGHKRDQYDVVKVKGCAGAPANPRGAQQGGLRIVNGLPSSFWEDPSAHMERRKLQNNSRPYGVNIAGKHRGTQTVDGNALRRELFINLQRKTVCVIAGCCAG